jgi:carbon storage regulator
MLVLSRKPSEMIQIGSQIEVTVVSVHGGRVRIGITAPKNVKVLRGELASPFGGEQREAVATLGTAPESSAGSTIEAVLIPG